MSNYKFLSWGANSHYQLGHGNQSEQCLLPKAVNLNGTDLRAEDVTKATGGAGHTLVLSRNGNVYACGWNHRGQAGIPGFETVKTLRRITNLSGVFVTDVECGWDSSAAIDVDGRLHVWGSNAYGQLGKNCREYPRIPEPTVIPFRDKVLRASLGLRHVAVVTQSGEVWVSGSGSHGQLGLIDDANKIVRNTETFTRVPNLTSIRMAACGQRHTTVLSESGELFAWGDNRHGQAGPVPMFGTGAKTPMKLEDTVANENSKIYCGWTHTILSNDGKIRAWGRNTYGQLGINDCESDKFIEVGKIVEIAVGSEHNVARTDDGRIVSWGWNEHGNCGNGTEIDVRIPSNVRFEDTNDYRGQLIGTGCGHSFAVINSSN